MILDQLKNNPNNPRTITKDDFARLLKSIRTFPKMMELRPIIYDENFVVLGGNQRLRALNELKNEIEIKESWFKSVSDLTDEEKKEFIVKDNIANGEWDYDALANEWSDLPLEEWGLDMAGWEEEKEVTEDNAPEVSTEPAISKLGEVYQLGNHRLMCGDSTKIEDVEKLMDGNKADMVFTDPPYGMEYKGEVFGKEGIKNDGLEWQQVLYDAITILPIDNGVVAICFAPARLKEFFKAVDSLDFHRRLTIYKPNRMAKPWRGWIMTSEDIYLFSKGTPIWNSENHKHDVYTHDYSERPDRSVNHPTVKPLSIVSDVIDKTSNKDSLVLDLFGGSGSTLIACEQLDRVCYMMELDEKYCDVIRKRYAKFINKEDEWQEITPKI